LPFSFDLPKACMASSAAAPKFKIAAAVSLEAYANVFS